MDITIHKSCISPNPVQSISLLTFASSRQSFGSLTDYCQRTLTIQKHEKSLQCGQCGKAVHCGRMGAVISHHIIDHACHHFGKKLFKCRQCNYEVIRPSSIKWHVRNIHNVKNSTLHFYNDLTSNYHEDLTAMIKRCFGTPFSTKQEVNMSSAEKKPLVIRRQRQVELIITAPR